MHFNVNRKTSLQISWQYPRVFPKRPIKNRRRYVMKIEFCAVLWIISYTLFEFCLRPRKARCKLVSIGVCIFSLALCSRRWNYFIPWTLLYNFICLHVLEFIFKQETVVCCCIMIVLYVKMLLLNIFEWKVHSEYIEDDKNENSKSINHSNNYDNYNDNDHTNNNDNKDIFESVVIVIIILW